MIHILSNCAGFLKKRTCRFFFLKKLSKTTNCRKSFLIGRVARRAVMPCAIFKPSDYLAPAASSIFTMSLYPRAFANFKGVLPCLSVSVRLAPALISAFSVA